MARSDYAFPFRIDPSSGQAAQASYAAHVDQMIRQILLTSPGERIDLPTFGCGLRTLVFAPDSAPLQATVQVMVQQSLNQWLAGQVAVQNVTVGPGEGGVDAAIVVQIQYLLVETQSSQTTLIQVS